MGGRRQKTGRSSQSIYASYDRKNVTSSKVSRELRRKRRRKRLIKAVIAWLVCIFLIALIAAGTVRGISALTSSKKRQYRQEGIEKLEAGDYGGAIEVLDQALEKSGKKAVAFNADVLKYRAEAEMKLRDYCLLYTSRCV